MHCVRRKIFRVDWLRWEFPGEEISVAKTKHPRFRPRIKSCWQNVAVSFRVARREKLYATETHRIARGPRRQRQQQSNDHPQSCEPEFFPIRGTAIANPQENQNGYEKQRRFRSNQGAEANHESAREPNFYRVEQIAVRGDAVDGHCRRRKKSQKSQRGEKSCQNLRERDCGVVGGEGTENSEPERRRRDTAARRVGSVRGQARSDARGH